MHKTNSNETKTWFRCLNAKSYMYCMPLCHLTSKLIGPTQQLKGLHSAEVKSRVGP